MRYIYIVIVTMTGLMTYSFAPNDHKEYVMLAVILIAVLANGWELSQILKATKADTKSETKALNICDVSNQRELLEAYVEFIEQPSVDGAYTHEEFIRMFLASNSC